MKKPIGALDNDQLRGTLVQVAHLYSTTIYRSSRLPTASAYRVR